MTALDPAQLASDLRKRILGGEFEVGSVLPREGDLAAELGVNRSTVRAAYRKLREQRLVEPRRNRGTVVLDPTGRDRLTRAAIERDERGYFLQAGGQRYKLLKHFGVQIAEAPPDVAYLLGVAVGSEVIVRDRVLGQERSPADGRLRPQPMILSTTYLPGWVAEQVPEVKKADPGPGGVTDRIEQSLGGPLSWHEIVTAELATAEVSTRLSIARTSAILRQQRVTTLPDGRVVEVLDQRVSGDKFEIMHPIPRAESAAWPLPDR